MAWWAWLTTGVCLLGAELLLIDTQCYLICIGASALLVGLADLAGISLPGYGEWAAFGLVSALMLVLLRARIADKFRDLLPGSDDGTPVGR